MNNLDTFDLRGFLLKFNGHAMSDYECDGFAMLYGWRWQVLATEVPK
jgi:hypothetical protein